MERFAIFDLRDHGFSHGRLAAEIFIGVPMTAIYHQATASVPPAPSLFAFRHIFRTVVRRLAAAEDHMAVRITLRLQQADLPARLMPTKRCGIAAARMALMAVALPSVPF